MVGFLPVPRSSKQKQAAAKRIAAAFQHRRPATTVVPVSEMDGILLVAGWFRRHPLEEARILQPDHVLTVLRERTVRKALHRG